MNLVSFRGAVSAAAALMLSVLGSPSAALAQSQTSPVPVAAATPASGATWIAQGTTPQATTATPAPAVVPTGRIQADSLRDLVGDMPVDTELSSDLKCLAQAVYFEARGEPLDGQLAVAEVVINRATSGQYPADYCNVITQPAQFSFVHHGRIPQPDENSDAWRRAKAVAQIAQQDLWESKARDALYFHATYVNPSWSHQKTELAQISTHIFYR